MVSKDKREEFVAISDGEDEGDFENQPQYIFMELKSTASFKDIDIDAMLEHTTFEEFMKGLFTSRITQQKLPKGKGDKPKTQFEEMWNSVMMGGEEDQ